MIARYEERELAEIWSDRRRFQFWLEVELALSRALEESAVIPAGVADTIGAKVSVDPVRIAEIERTTKHDLIAFCSSITEQVDPAVGKYFHYGVTSSDIIDSALSLQIAASLDLTLPALAKLLHTLHRRALQMKGAVVMGRSHGMDAEPMSFGQKLLGHYNEFSRRHRELAAFRASELTVQFSGAVGNHTLITPACEQQAARLLGMPVEPLSTQVIPRDRLAKLVGMGALTGAAIERLAVELRHLHKSDTAELHEGFSPGQKGSSIMPHKKNPVSAENLTGIARVLRNHWPVAAENVVLWHERDISHSSAERLYLPDHLGLLLYAIKRLDGTVRDLVFHEERMKAKVDSREGYLSAYCLHRLLAETPLTREELYPVLQEASFSPAGFREALNSGLEKRGIDWRLPELDIEQIKGIYLRHVDAIFERSCKEYPLPLVPDSGGGPP